jgi:hypothetical protein
MHSYSVAMEFTSAGNLGTIISHPMFGLVRENLIENTFELGPLEHIRSRFAAAEQPGILITPSALGVELYLWAHGLGDSPLNAILDPRVEFSSAIRISTAPGIRSTEMADRGIPKPVLPEGTVEKI